VIYGFGGIRTKRNQFKFIRCLIITKTISMMGYVENVHLFPVNLLKSKIAGQKNIAGGSSLYIYSQLPFVGTLFLPAFFFLLI